MNVNINYIENADASVYLKNIPDNFIDLTITSPPYDKIRSYKGRINNDVYDDYYSFPFVTIANELYRVTKDGGIVVWVVNDQTIDGSESGNSFRQALKFIEIGFKLHDTMIYQKNSSTYPASRKSNRYTQIFEYMFVFSKGKPKTHNLIADKKNKWAGHTNWGKNTKRKYDEELSVIEKIKPVPEHSVRNNIWTYNNGGGFATKDKIAHKHPAIFCEQLALDHILSWSNEGDVILDPMCGSGTTCKMAKLNNRNFIGIEVNKEYYDIANSRIFNDLSISK